MAQTATERLDRAFLVTSKRTSKFIVTSIHPDCKLKNERACGNTTRQVDFIIQNLFSGNAVLCLDHTANGERMQENNRLMDTVLRRLKAEHPGLVHPDFIEYNHLYNYIFLKEVESRA